MTMIDVDPEDCPHGMGNPAWCVLCNGRAKREAAEANEITHRFTARFDGHCGRCATPTSPGDVLAATNDGRYLCGECT